MQEEVKWSTFMQEKVKYKYLWKPWHCNDNKNNLKYNHYLNLILFVHLEKMAKRYNTKEALQMLFDPSFLGSLLDKEDTTVQNPYENGEVVDIEYESVLNVSKLTGIWW